MCDEINHKTDVVSIQCVQQLVRGLSMSDRRAICAIIRDPRADPSLLMPKWGITLGQYSIAFLLEINNSTSSKQPKAMT